MSREQEIQRRVELIHRVGERLLELVRPEFPRTVERSVPEHRHACVALVARAAGTLEAILRLSDLRREADLAVLIRSLFDHAVILAWLAIDPANYARWKEEDARHRVKVHREWKSRLSEELLSAENLAFFERIAADQPPGPTALIDRAIAADVHWADRLGFPPGETPFTDWYQVVFRYSSSRTHASLQGLNDVTELTPSHVVTMLEPTTGNQAIAGTGIVVFSLVLRVSAIVNGFPAYESIDEVMAEYLPGRLEGDE